MIIALGMFNLACSALIAVFGAWLIADRRHRRTTRLFLGIITCGAVVNSVALVQALLDVGYLAHAFVWPSEAVVNFGAAVMMSRWCRVASFRHPSAEP